MPVPTLFDRLRESGLLSASVLAQVAELPEAKNPDPRVLGTLLLRRNLLTRYQINKLAAGKLNELRIGAYLLLDQLGEGGMGLVFKARQPHLNRDVALKVIRKNRLASPEAVERFYQEVAAAGQLHHPNIVLAFDAGCWENTHYFAMEYVSGPDLARLVREKGPLPVGLACEYARQAAVGLHHAHQRGLIHRDVKPSNLLLAPAAADGLGTIKLLDLGLARLTAPIGSVTPTSTRDGAIVGTPDYLAPEQARNPTQADARADLYALGGTLCYLLTGKPPYQAESLTQLLLMHVGDPPPPLCQMRPDVPTEVEAMVHWLMAKRPQDRPSSAAEVADHLARLTGLPFAEVTVERVVAPPPLPVPANATTANPFAAVNAESLEEQPVRRSRRRSSGSRMMTVGLLLALLGVVVGLSYTLWRGLSQEDSRPAPEPVVQAPTPEQPPDPPLEEEEKQPDPIRPAKKDPEIPAVVQPIPAIPASETLQKFQRAAFQLPGGTALVCITPEGKRGVVATGKTIRLVDLATGKTIREFLGHTANVTLIVLSPPGRLLLSADESGQARLWEVDSAKQRGTLTHAGPVVSAAISTDEAVVITGTEKLAGRSPASPGLALWDALQVGLIHDFDTESAPRVALAGNGKMGLASTRERALMVWPLSIRPNPDPRHKPALTGPVQLLPVGDSRLLLAGSGKLLLWDLDKAAPVGPVVDSKETWSTLTLDGGGRRLLGLLPDKNSIRLQLRDLDSLREVGRLMLPSTTVSASLSADAQLGLFGQSDGVFRLLALSEIAPMSSKPGTPTPASPMAGHTGKVWSLAFSLDGKTLISGGEDKTARLWRVQPLEPVRVLETSQPVHWVRFTQVGKQVLALNRDGSGELFDIDSGANQIGLKLAQAPIRLIGLDLTPGSIPRAVAASAREISLFDLTKPRGNEEPARRIPRQVPIHCVSVMPNASLVLWGDEKGIVHLHKWLDEKEIGSYNAHKGAVTCLACSLKGQRILSGGQDGSVQLRSPQNLVFSRNLPAHKGAVVAVSVSGDGSRFASAGEDGQVQVCDGSGRALHRFSYDTPPEALCLSPDGRILATAGPEGVRLHDLTTKPNPKP